MLWLDRLVAGFARELGSLLQSLERLFGEPFLSHVDSYPKAFRAPNRLSVSWLHARAARVGGTADSHRPSGPGQAHHGRHGQSQEGTSPPLSGGQLRPGAARQTDDLADPAWQTHG